MSRSYKHTPIFKCSPSSKHNGVKFMKRLAAKAVRRCKDVTNERRTYRLLVNPYDMHDQVGYWTWRNCVENFYRRRLFYIAWLGWSAEKCYEELWTPFNKWAKTCYRK